MNEPAEPAQNRLVLTRRAFLAAGGAAGGLILVACTPEHGDHHAEATAAADGYRFFTDTEAALVDAIVARLIPGDAQDPGGVEAGVTNYIDSKLASFDGWAQKTYVDGPFVQVVGTQAEADMANADAHSLLVPADELSRYGLQSPVRPQQLYRAGLPALEEFSRTQFGAAFAGLAPSDQDAVLSVLDDAQPAGAGASSSGNGTGAENGTGNSSSSGGGSSGNGSGGSNGTGNSSGSGGSGGGSGSGSGGGNASDPLQRAAQAAFGTLSPGDFFSNVHTDAMEGMFADPSYGGNRNLIGWNLIGYPGPRRSYSPEEMLVGIRLRPQSLSDLPKMNPDHHHGGGTPAIEQSLKGVHDG